MLNHYIILTKLINFYSPKSSNLSKFYYIHYSLQHIHIAWEILIMTCINSSHKERENDFAKEHFSLGIFEDGVRVE